MNFSPDKNSNLKHESIKHLAWKKWLTVLFAGALSFGTLRAGDLSLTQEEKKKAIEFMKSSPEQVRAYEAKFIEMAKDSVMYSANPKSLDKNNFKEIIIDDSTTVHIDYEKGVPVSLTVEKNSETGAALEIGDGNDGEKMDGRVDGVQAGTIDPVTLTMDNPFVKFVEVKNEKGESVYEARCDDPDFADYLKQTDAYGMLYVNAQAKFQQLLADAAHSVDSASELASK